MSQLGRPLALLFAAAAVQLCPSLFGETAAPSMGRHILERISHKPAPSRPEVPWAPATPENDPALSSGSVSATNEQPPAPPAEPISTVATQPSPGSGPELEAPSGGELQAPPASPAPPPPQLHPCSGSRLRPDRYTLAPGDSLQLGMVGKPTLEKLAIPVSPDGTLSYLQARQVPVLGKTVDEVRAEIQARLEPYHLHPLVTISVVQAASRAYTILGEVRKNGTYALTRPTTLLEAVTSAGGFQTGRIGDRAGDLADLKRSYVARKGKKLDVDMEALFLQGAFAQNIDLEPGDYIYIASSLQNEIFVLGKVKRPGAYPIRPGMTAIGAIAAAEGMEKTAWRNRVLVVRGKLHQPETHVVELNRMLHGRSADLELEPGDLVYVATRPWSYPAQVLDSALAAYIDGSIAGLLVDGTLGIGVGPAL